MLHEDEQLIWLGSRGEASKLAPQLETILAQLSTGVVLCKSDETDMWPVMANEVAATYFGGPDAHKTVTKDLREGLRYCGVLDAARLAQFTGETQHLEGIVAPGTLAFGQLMDVTASPLDTATVAITFVDVS